MVSIGHDLLMDLDQNRRVIFATCDQAVHSVRDMWRKARKFSFLDKKLGLNYRDRLKGGPQVA